MGETCFLDPSNIYAGSCSLSSTVMEMEEEIQLQQTDHGMEMGRRQGKLQFFPFKIQILIHSGTLPSKYP